MNILIVGNCSNDFVGLLQQSSLLHKLYITANSIEIDVPKIEYSTEEELAQKCKQLQIDIAINTEQKFIVEGLIDYLKSRYINIISPNKKWFNLEKSRLIAKQLLTHYSINIPKKILAPKEFPLILRTDSLLVSKIVNSMNELIGLMDKYKDEEFFLEEYLDGELFSLLTIWDGLSARYFINLDVLTEVQKDRLDILQTKFNFLLSDEKADFIGFFVIKLIWAKNDWHVLDFKMCFDEKLVSERVKKDLLYILELAIYQKIDTLR